MGAVRAATAEAADERPQAAGARQRRLLASYSQPLASWVAGREWQGVTPSGPNATRFVGSTATVWTALVGLSRQLEARAQACACVCACRRPASIRGALRTAGMHMPPPPTAAAAAAPSHLMKPALSSLHSTAEPAPPPPPPPSCHHPVGYPVGPKGARRVTSASTPCASAHASALERWSRLPSASCCMVRGSGGGPTARGARLTPPLPARSPPPPWLSLGWDMPDGTWLAARETILVGVLAAAGGVVGMIGMLAEAVDVAVGAAVGAAVRSSIESERGVLARETASRC